MGSDVDTSDVPEIVAYGSADRQRLAVWRSQTTSPAPVVLYFHGGGFRAGDYRGITPDWIAECRKSGVCIASAGYRLRDSNPTRGEILLDGARALQTLRYRAEDLNIDPTRVATFGGSAGGHIALWLAYHADLGDAAAADPVSRQSTRVLATAGIATQLLPVDRDNYFRYLDADRVLVRNVLRFAALLRHMQRTEQKWYREPYVPDDFASVEQFNRVRHDYYCEYGVFEQAAADAPPTFFCTHGPPTAEKLLRDELGNAAEIDVHHPVLMLMLRNRLVELGVETEWNASREAMFRFLFRHLS